MTKPIEVGCWAVNYKPMPCCGQTASGFGIPFVVTKIDRSFRGWATVCLTCEAPVHDATSAYGVFGDPNCATLLALCKRIDPPSESLSQTTAENGELQT